MVVYVNDRGVLFNEALFRNGPFSRDKLQNFITEMRRDAPNAKIGTATAYIDPSLRYARLYYKLISDYHKNPRKLQPPQLIQRNSKWTTGGAATLPHRPSRLAYPSKPPAPVAHSAMPMARFSAPKIPSATPAETHSATMPTSAPTMSSSAATMPTSATMSSSATMPTSAPAETSSATTMPSSAPVDPPSLPSIPVSSEYAAPVRRNATLSYLDGVRVNATDYPQNQKINIGEIFRDMPATERPIQGPVVTAGSMQYAMTISYLKDSLINEIKDACETLGHREPDNLAELTYSQLEGYFARLNRRMRQFSMQQNLNNTIVTIGGGLEKIFDGRNDVPGIGRGLRFRNLSKNLQQMEATPSWNYAMKEIAKNHTVEISPWFTIGISLVTALINSAVSTDDDDSPNENDSKAITDVAL